MRLKPEDLGKIQERMRATTVLREGAGRAKVTVHLGTCGIAAGAREVLQAFLLSVREVGVTDVIVTTSGCAGLCIREPMATVEVEGQAPVKYVDLDADKARRIFREHVQGSIPVAEYAFVQGSERIS
jgi:NADP-reducing hydrogenase subunit HndB